MNNWPRYSADLLTLSTLIRLLNLILIQEELKPASLTLSAALSLTSSIISCFNAGYFCTNLAQFDTDIAKINFTITYLTGVAQNWFEVGLNQEDQSILQDWLSN